MERVVIPRFWCRQKLEAQDLVVLKQSRLWGFQAVSGIPDVLALVASVDHLEMLRV
jgi:hypothetical protein